MGVHPTDFRHQQVEGDQGHLLRDHLADQDDAEEPAACGEVDARERSPPLTW